MNQGRWRTPKVIGTQGSHLAVAEACGSALESLTRADRAALRERPRTRGECADGPRPCPWVGCRHHLYMDVSEVTGSITVNRPGVELEDLAETCSLDVADRTELKLAEVGVLMDVTRERVRQIEARALVKLQARLKRRGVTE